MYQPKTWQTLARAISLAISGNGAGLFELRGLDALLLDPSEEHKNDSDNVFKRPMGTDYSNVSFRLLSPTDRS